MSTAHPTAARTRPASRTQRLAEARADMQRRKRDWDVGRPGAAVAFFGAALRFHVLADGPCSADAQACRQLVVIAAAQS